MDSMMPPPPGPYFGKSSLALVLRVTRFFVGVLYGTIKHEYLQATKPSAEKQHPKRDIKTESDCSIELMKFDMGGSVAVLGRQRLFN